MLPLSCYTRLCRTLRVSTTPRAPQPRPPSLRQRVGRQLPLSVVLNAPSAAAPQLCCCWKELLVRGEAWDKGIPASWSRKKAAWNIARFIPAFSEEKRAAQSQFWQRFIDSVSETESFTVISGSDNIWCLQETKELKFQLLLVHLCPIQSRIDAPLFGHRHHNSQGLCDFTDTTSKSSTLLMIRPSWLFGCHSIWVVGSLWPWAAAVPRQRDSEELWVAQMKLSLPADQLSKAFLLSFSENLSRYSKR